MKESSRISYSVVKLLIDKGTLKIDDKVIPKTPQEETDKVKLILVKFIKDLIFIYIFQRVQLQKMDQVLWNYNGFNNGFSVI